MGGSAWTLDTEVRVRLLLLALDWERGGAGVVPTGPVDRVQGRGNATYGGFIQRDRGSPRGVRLMKRF